MYSHTKRTVLVSPDNQWQGYYKETSKMHSILWLLTRTLEIKCPDKNPSCVTYYLGDFKQDIKPSLNQFICKRATIPPNL